MSIVHISIANLYEYNGTRIEVCNLFPCVLKKDWTPKQRVSKKEWDDLGELMAMEEDEREKYRIL